MKEDKDIVILKYNQECVRDAETGLNRISESNVSQEKRLEELRNKVKALQQKTGNKESRSLIQTFKLKSSSDSMLKVFEISPCNLTYDDLYQTAYSSLIERGMDPDDVDYHNLVSEEELSDLVKELNSALPKEEKWTKSDYIVMFVAAFVGALADTILSDRDNKLTGKKSKFSKMLNELHEKTLKHKSGAPIDYQGKHFGGGYHRGLSKGHDIIRFVEGIMQLKNGRFEALRYENGIPIKVVKFVNQFGTEYTTLTTIEAILEYALHMFADLFSTYSLPFPGYSFLVESNNRNLRKFAADMYQNGFNCKNVMTQSVSTIIIELIIRLYFSIQSVKEYSEEIEINEDFSNIDVLKRFINPGHKEKLHEMLLAAHAIVTGVNTGKIVIKCLVAKDLKSVSEINISEIIATVRYGVSVLKQVAARNNEYAKLIYHADNVQDYWEELDRGILEDEKIVITDPEISLLI